MSVSCFGVRCPLSYWAILTSALFSPYPNLRPSSFCVSLRNIRIFLILAPNFNFFSFSKWGCAVTTAPEHYLYYHLRFLLTATTVPRHPADTARVRTKIAIFVLSPVFGELDTEVASEPWEPGVLPS